MTDPSHLRRRLRSTASRRGAPPRSEPSAAQRILATATDLFQREGIRATGVDTIVAESGVSKTSLYRCYPSKDDLIVAFMESMDARFWAWWDAKVAGLEGRPAAQLEAILRGYAQRSSHAEFRGCPFLNASTEFRDLDHGASVVAETHQRELHRRLETLCHELRLADPAEAAGELALLINGVNAGGFFASRGALEQRVLRAADAIVAAHGSP